jgi:hypothetical protein
MFFALSLIHKDIVRLVLVFLMVGGFKVIFLCIVFLKIKLFFQVNIRDAGTKLDNIIPKLFFFLVSLFDATDGHI